MLVYPGATYNWVPLPVPWKMYWKTRQQIRRKILWDRNIIFPWVFPMVIWSSLKNIYIYIYIYIMDNPPFSGSFSTIFRQFQTCFTQIIGAGGWIKRQLPRCLDDRRPTLNGDTLKLFYLFAGYLIYMCIYIYGMRWRHIIQDGDSTNCWNRKKKNLT